MDTEINDQSNIEILKTLLSLSLYLLILFEPNVPEDVYIEGNVDLDENIEKVEQERKMKWW